MRETTFDSASEENLRVTLFNTTGTERYENVLSSAQQHISQNFTGEIDSMSETDLKDIILKYITDYSITCGLTDSPAVLTNHIYHDMSELSFITRENLLEREGFEELDVNGWNDVDMIVNGKRIKTDYKFLNPQHANDILRRMMQKTATTFDAAIPYAITDLGKSVRIAALKSPLIDEDMGIACSIRRVSGSSITREKLVDSALTEKMLNLLLLFLSHGISVCFSGETGSGKTTLAGYLLNEARRSFAPSRLKEPRVGFLQI